MAGDWIKMREDLAGDPAVLGMADILRIDEPDLIVGKLHRFWSWASANTVDGKLAGVTQKRIDALVGQEGFTDALIQVGWLARFRTGVKIPNFERHMSASAKARAGDSLRKSIERKKMSAQACPDSCPDTSRTRAEAAKSTKENKLTDSNQQSGEPLPPIQASPQPAVALLSAEQVCRLLRRVEIDGKPLYSRKVAFSIGRSGNLSLKHVVWAVMRTREARASGAVKNAGGYLRTLLTAEYPPPDWFAKHEGEQFNKLLRQLALDQIVAEFSLQAIPS